MPLSVKVWLLVAAALFGVQVVSWVVPMVIFVIGLSLEAKLRLIVLAMMAIFMAGVMKMVAIMIEDS